METTQSYGRHPLLPLRGTSPKGGSEGLYEFAQVLAKRKYSPHPSGAMRRPQPCIKRLYAVEDGYIC